jgi:hypothetical protein
VRLIVADCTDSGTALLALTDLAAVFDADVIGFDPLATTLTDAVDFILGLKFQELPVPGPFEVLGEEFVDVLQINMVIGTTAWWHVGGIGETHLENALETCMAHAVFAWQTSGFRDGDIVGAAGET